MKHEHGVEACHGLGRSNHNYNRFESLINVWFQLLVDNPNVLWFNCMIMCLDCEISEIELGLPIGTWFN